MIDGNGYLNLPFAQTGGEYAFDGMTLTGKGLPAVRVTAEERENEVRLFLAGEGEMRGELRYPYPIQTQAGDLLVIPYCEGIAFRAEETDLPLAERLPATGSGLSMAFFGIIRGKTWLLCAIYTNLDAHVLFPKNGTWTPRICFLSEKGQFGYMREVRYLWGTCADEGDGITAMCRAYRKIAEEKGFRVPAATLREKAKRVPAVERLTGAANVWLWNSDAMEKLYAATAEYKVPTAEQNARRMAIAEDMKRSGMTRVLWSIFDENIDLPTLNAIKSLGYLTTTYDIYTDLIPHDIADLIPDTRRVRCTPRYDFWPAGVARAKDGTPVKAWQLKGKDGVFHDQHRMCDAAAVSCASREVPKHCEKYGLDGRFIDVTLCGVTECYSPDHPCTRRESMEHKRELFRVLRKNGLFRGTEVGCEDAAAEFEYNEGLMSPPVFRQPDAGRRMTHVYYGDEIHPRVRELNLNPAHRVPLWELVYHGYVQSYWYWGDSANSMPELMNVRDCFCLLYGLPQLFSVCETEWENMREAILRSYNATTPFAEKVGMCEMETFAYLDGTDVQKTTFSDGSAVIANFGEKPFIYEGKEIPTLSAVAVQ